MMDRIVVTAADIEKLLAWRAVPFASVHLLDRIMRRNAQKA